MIQYGEPYEKMRGIAQLSDATLAGIIMWAYWSGVTLFGIMFVLIFINYHMALIPIIAACTVAWLVLTVAQSVSSRRRNTWRPIVGPVTITDVVRIATVNDTDPSHVVKNYRVSIKEGKRRSYEVLGEFDATISKGSLVTGDIVPDQGEVRNLRVVPSQA